MPERQFVFGYGSLAAVPRGGLTRDPAPEGFVAELPGLVRVWGVAMDNRRDLPGYKYYTRPNGIRPAVYVAFLDLAEAAGGSGPPPNGVCLPVDDGDLELLDRRERNYRRVDVSDRIGSGEIGSVEIGSPGRESIRVWTYLGTPEGRRRLALGVAGENAVIEADYLHEVRAGFESLGEGESAAAAASLSPGGLPVDELVRHQLT